MEIDDKLKSNISSVISSADTWLRILFIIGFGVLAYFVLLPLIWVLAGVQLLFLLVTAERNPTLHAGYRSLAAWLSQVFSYMLYVSDHKPFPLSDLPEVTEEEEALVDAQPAAKASPDRADANTPSAAKKTKKAETEDA